MCAKDVPGRLASSRLVPGLPTYSSLGPRRGCTPASSPCVSISLYLSLFLSVSVYMCVCVGAYVCISVWVVGWVWRGLMVSDWTAFKIHEI